MCIRDRNKTKTKVITWYYVRQSFENRPNVYSNILLILRIRPSIWSAASEIAGQWWVQSKSIWHLQYNNTGHRYESHSFFIWCPLFFQGFQLITLLRRSKNVFAFLVQVNELSYAIILQRKSTNEEANAFKLPKSREFCFF